MSSTETRIWDSALQPFVVQAVQTPIRKGHSLEKLVTLTTNNTKEKEKMMESIAQEYIDRGKQEGMQKGLETTARNMFQAGEPIERIARWTGLSEASIRSL